jgi:hypothetical protein
MSYIFGMPLTQHAQLQIEKVVPQTLRFWKSSNLPEQEDDMELFSYQHAFKDKNHRPPTDTNDVEQQAMPVNETENS